MEPVYRSANKAAMCVPTMDFLPTLPERRLYCGHLSIEQILPSTVRFLRRQQGIV